MLRERQTRPELPEPTAPESVSSLSWNMHIGASPTSGRLVIGSILSTKLISLQLRGPMDDDRTPQTVDLVPEPSPFTETGNIVALFAGIGGLELGLHRSGRFHTELAVELMPEARACLVERFGLREGHSALEDVTDSALPSKLPTKIDILTAGFPCQDLSQAGKLAGIQGARSGLILHVLDVLERRSEAQRPNWLLLENVAFMRHIGGGEAMRIVLDRLTHLGYAWAYRQLDTNAFGLPQRRSRVFFVACKFGLDDPRAVLLTDDATRPPQPSGPTWENGMACGFYWTEGNRGVGWGFDAVPALKGGSTVQIPSPPAIVHPTEGLVLPTIEDAEALQGFDRGWTKPAIGKGRDRNGRMRWYLVGNAVSVPVSEWVGARLARPQPYPKERIGQCHPVAGTRWPAAGWRVEPGQPAMESPESDWPLDQQTRDELGLKTQSLAELLAESNSPRSPLSERAARGFMNRFERSSLLEQSDPALRSALLSLLTKLADNTPT
jgi:DNA (cytosine-5)-methyltransferase 1